MTNSKQYRLFPSIRLLVLILAVCSGGILYLTRINLNLTIVSMVRYHPSSNKERQNNFTDDGCRHLYANSSSNNSKNKSNQGFDWDQELQGHIISSFYYGYILFQVIGGRLAEIFGAKWLCAFTLLVPGIINLLTPIIAYWGSGYLIGSRVILGMMQSVAFPAFYVLIAKWFPDQERSTALGLFTAGSNFGAIIANIVAGQLAASNFLGGWPSVFYTIGFASCVWFIFIATFVFSEPRNHPCISINEIDYIEDNNGSKGKKSSNIKDKVPWLKIFTTKSVLAFILIKFTMAWNYLLVVTKVPSYLQSVHNFPINQNGLLMASMYLSVALSMIFGGFLSDFIVNRKILTKYVSRRVFESIASIGSSVCLALIPLAGCNREIVIGLLIGGMLVLGLQCGGETPLVTDMTTKYTGTVLAIANTVGSMGGIAGPIVIGYIINSDEYSLHLWSYAFYSGAVLNFFGIFTFLLWADPSIQSWDNNSESYNENISAKIRGQSYGNKGHYNQTKGHYNQGFDNSENIKADDK